MQKCENKKKTYFTGSGFFGLGKPRLRALQ